MAAFCDFCGRNVTIAMNDAHDTPPDYFCMGCKQFVCGPCHEAREMPTGPHTSAQHKLRAWPKLSTPRKKGTP